MQIYENGKSKIIHQEVYCVFGLMYNIKTFSPQLPLNYSKGGRVVQNGVSDRVKRIPGSDLRCNIKETR